jgi:DNA polymerase-1
MGGFIRSLGFLIDKIRPSSVYVVFDGAGSSVNRRNLLPEYKSGRNLTRITHWEVFDDVDDENDAKVGQISRLIHYLQCLPVKLLSIPKAEADDIIAYMAKHMPDKYDSHITIVSSDKDFLQLADSKVDIYRPIEKEVFSYNQVKEKFGLLPENFILRKVLLGDASDKIVGVKGLGDKGLLKKFPELATQILTLENIFEIAETKYKQHEVYSRIVLDKIRLEQSYKLMDLSNPLLDENDKINIQKAIKSPTPGFHSKEFLELYNEDGLGHIIRNVDFWLKNCFTQLTSYE